MKDSLILDLLEQGIEMSTTFGGSCEYQNIEIVARVHCWVVQSVLVVYDKRWIRLSNVLSDWGFRANWLECLFCLGQTCGSLEPHKYVLFGTLYENMMQFVTAISKSSLVIRSSTCCQFGCLFSTEGNLGHRRHYLVPPGTKRCHTFTELLPHTQNDEIVDKIIS